MLLPWELTPQEIKICVLLLFNKKQLINELIVSSYFTHVDNKCWFFIYTSELIAFIFIGIFCAL